MNRLESIRKAAIKSGIAQGNATVVPTHQLETFTQCVIDDFVTGIVASLNQQPLNDTAQSIAVWIKEQA